MLANEENHDIIVSELGRIDCRAEAGPARPTDHVKQEALPRSVSVVIRNNARTARR